MFQHVDLYIILFLPIKKDIILHLRAPGLLLILGHSSGGGTSMNYSTLTNQTYYVHEKCQIAPVLTSYTCVSVGMGHGVVVLEFYCCYLVADSQNQEKDITRSHAV